MVLTSVELMMNFSEEKDKKDQKKESQNILLLENKKEMKELLVWMIRNNFKMMLTINF